MKVGILSLYYNNANYGGLLQAYALLKALDKLGVKGEQICFDAKKSPNPLVGRGLTKKEKIKKFGLNYLFFILETKGRKLLKKAGRKAIISPERYNELLEKRIQCLKAFEENMIPHSQKVFDKESIAECGSEYDAFICGSDQIWNPSYIRDEYLLKFVPAEKKRISYAASISRNFLSDSQKEYMCTALSGFDAVSVREKTALQLLNKEKLQEKITWMPDPTLLLSSKDWEELLDSASNKNEIEGDYIFCYFLGNSERQRKIISSVAQKMKLQIVSFPHVLGKVRESDISFPCREEYNASPADFLRLIKNARYVVTDSFHATVFSIIFRRDFIVFNRERESYENNMISRLIDLLGGAGLSERLVKESVNAVEKLLGAKCDFTQAEEWLKENRERGLGYLRNALEK